MERYSFVFTHEIDMSIMNKVNPPSCLQWNQQMYRLFTRNRRTSVKKLESHHEEDDLNLLPYDIIVDILARLPAKQLLLCGHVCTPLRPFITTPFFVDQHLHRAKPIIVFQYYLHRPPLKKTSCMVDINFSCEKTTKMVLSKRIKIHLGFANPVNTYCMPFLYGSHNGFLVFKDKTRTNVLFVWNPITQENLTLDTQCFLFKPCAFYFHPRSREHRVLVSCSVYKEYVVVSLETGLSRVLTCKFCHPPHRNLYKNPIILNGALHWPAVGTRIGMHCSNSIVAFNIDREDFHTIPHPGYQCVGRNTSHYYLQIIEMEGKLCYCDYQSPCTEIRLWILEDYDKQVWVQKHLVITDIMKNSIAKSYSERQLDDANVEVVHMYGDELLINLFRKNLFLYNLQLGTFRRIEVGGEKSKTKTLIHPVAHINSLVSLKKMDGRPA